MGSVWYLLGSGHYNYEDGGGASEAVRVPFCQYFYNFLHFCFNFAEI